MDSSKSSAQGGKPNFDLAHECIITLYANDNSCHEEGAKKK